VIDERSIVLRPASAADSARIASLFTDEGYPAGPSDIDARLERFGSPYSMVLVADHVRVLALVVDPGVRERGVGHLLMSEAERVGREVDAAFVEITAGHHRPEARHLYEALGYDSGMTTYLRKRL